MERQHSDAFSLAREKMLGMGDNATKLFSPLKTAVCSCTAPTAHLSGQRRSRGSQVMGTVFTDLLYKALQGLVDLKICFTHGVAGHDEK